jgi:hypothetical protein
LDPGQRLRKALIRMMEDMDEMAEKETRLTPLTAGAKSE